MPTTRSRTPRRSLRSFGAFGATGAWGVPGGPAAAPGAAVGPLAPPGPVAGPTPAPGVRERAAGSWAAPPGPAPAAPVASGPLRPNGPLRPLGGPARTTTVPRGASMACSTPAGLDNPCERLVEIPSPCPWPPPRKAAVALPRPCDVRPAKAGDPDPRKPVTADPPRQVSTDQRTRDRRPTKAAAGRLADASSRCRCKGSAPGTLVAEALRVAKAGFQEHLSFQARVGTHAEVGPAGRRSRAGGGPGGAGTRPGSWPPAVAVGRRPGTCRPCGRASRGLPWFRN